MRISVNFLFVEIEAELWALGEFLGVIEPQLAHLREQEDRRLAERLDCDEDDGERQLAFQEHESRVAHVLTRFVRGPFVLALWAAYESAYTEVANYLRSREGVELRLKEIRGKNDLDSADKYYRTVLHVALDDDNQRPKRIHDVYLLRNARRDTLEQLLKREPGISIVRDAWVAPTAEYLHQAYSDVNKSARHLVDRVRGGPSVVFLPPDSDTVHRP